MISVLARSASAEIIRYAEPAGHHKLRKQLARRSGDWGCLMKPEDFVVTNGTTEAIALALRTVCLPNAAVLVESPTYYGILEMIENLGLRVVELPTDARTGVSPDDIEHAIQSIPRIGACLLVTNFSNPLGCTMLVEKKKRLVSILARYRVPLIGTIFTAIFVHPAIRVRSLQRLLTPRVSSSFAVQFPRRWLPA